MKTKRLSIKDEVPASPTRQQPTPAAVTSSLHTHSLRSRLSPTRPTTDHHPPISPSPKLMRRKPTLFSYADWEQSVTQGQVNSRALRGTHEAVGAKFLPHELDRFSQSSGVDHASEYGGITGTILSSAFSRMMKSMMGITSDAVIPGSATELDTQYALEKHSSIFLDVGCGTGRPTLAMAGLPLKLSLGLDIDPLQILNSCMNYTTMRRRGIILNTPVAFFKDDVYHLQSFDPVTHVYAFVGYEDIVYAIANVAAKSTTIKALALVVLRDKEMREVGLYDPQIDTDVIRLGSMAMAGGNGYSGFVFPMTTSRKDRVLKICSVRKAENQPSRMHDLHDIVCRCAGTMEGCEKLMKEQSDVALGPAPKRGAAKRALANITGGISER